MLISEADICQRYRAGEPLTAIGQRAGLWSSDLKALLVRNGMPMRTPAEINALKGRNRHVGTLRLGR
jgi:hypothetical protein